MTRYFVLGAALALLACSESTNVQMPEDQSSFTERGFRLAPRTPILGIDAEFAALQESIATFAGAYFIADTLVVHVTDLADTDPALMAARAWARSKDRLFLHQRVTRVDYSWDRLMDFRRTAGKAAALGAVSIDANEVHNRITVGAPDETAASLIHSALVKAGIPPTAIEVVIERASVDHSCSGGDDIRNRCGRPLAGFRLSMVSPRIAP